MTGRSVANGVERTILHVDMDAFFVSVELLDRPELRGTPVIVGGSGPRGVVAAASYEVRSFGVRSAMPVATARRLCPGAVILDGRLSRYREVSERVMAIFERFTPLVEPLSLDEAFLDVSGARRSIGDGPTIAAMIRSAVNAEEGLQCSVGVAPSKFLAKLATETAKPSATPTGPLPGLGVAVVEPDRIDAFLHPLPIGALWGVGPATHAKLSRLGIRTVGDCARLDLATLQLAVGEAHGRHLHELCRGVDDRPVVADLAPKSISHEQTFAVDLVDADALDLELARLAQGVSIRLRGAVVAARVVTIKVRDPGFVTVTRSRTVNRAVDDGQSLLVAARGLLADVDVSAGVRLLGIAAGGLVATDEPQQMSLDLRAAPGSGATAVLDPAIDPAVGAAVDRIRDRFGSAAIGSARLASRPGVAPAAPGERPWGPAPGAPPVELR